jgi:hypothetical protein
MAVKLGFPDSTWTYQDVLDTFGPALGPAYAMSAGVYPGQTTPVTTMAASPQVTGLPMQGVSNKPLRETIAEEIRQQQEGLKKAGVFDQVWRPGIDTEEVIQNMAERLEKAGVFSIKDLAIGTVPGDLQVIGGDGENQIFGPGPDRQALINTRTGQEIPPEYAFADISGGGSTWGGTFAGPGSTRYTINFVNGVPVFGAQQQATVKSGLEKIAPSIAGALAT